MAVNFIQEGDRIDYTNAGSAIASGDVVVMGSVLGIALVDIATDKTGSVAVCGVWRLPKTTPLAIAVGEQLFWDTGTSKITKTATDKPIGWATAAAGSNATTVDVHLTSGGDGVPQAAVVAPLGTTTDLAVLVVTATVIADAVITAATISASNFTAANAAEPTKAEIDAGIDALAAKVVTALAAKADNADLNTIKAAIVTALDLKADNADVETLRTEVEARLDAIEANQDAILTALKDAGLMASA